MIGFTGDGSGGYSGIQETGNGKVIIFSIWRTHHHFPKKTRSASFGTVENFGGEGTGLRFLGKWNWLPGTDITMEIQGRPRQRTGIYRKWEITCTLIYQGHRYFIDAVF